ncbi:hypothetical protein ABIB15_002480 [Marisediminicola sp. UYEF4]
MYVVLVPAVTLALWVLIATIELIRRDGYGPRPTLPGYDSRRDWVQYRL